MTTGERNWILFGLPEEDAITLEEFQQLASPPKTETPLADNESSDPVPRLPIHQPWMKQAACVGLTDLFFPAREKVVATLPLAQAICGDCPVRQECIDYSLLRDEEGIWGGMSQNQRRKLRRGFVDDNQVGNYSDNTIAEVS